MRKFNIGDLVIGNEEADKRYSITRKGFIGEVIGFDTVMEKRIKIHSTECGSFEVFEYCFDLYRAVKQAVNYESFRQWDDIEREYGANRHKYGEKAIEIVENGITFAVGMRIFCGMKMTIKKCLTEDRFKLNEDHGYWYWSSEMFEESKINYDQLSEIEE